MGILKKLGNLMGVPDDGYDGYEDEEIDFINNQQSSYSGMEQNDHVDVQESVSASAQQKRNKVVNINATTQT